jgi:quercetin dioxygenase-like cupin family protein
MFSKFEPEGFLTPVPGIKMKTFVHGDNTLLTRFHLKEGAVLPKHSHPHEQTGFMVSGRMKLFFDGKEHTAEPGDSWCIKGGVEHWAQILEDSVAIEVFSPVREDYLP